MLGSSTIFANTVFIVVITLTQTIATLAAAAYAQPDLRATVVAFLFDLRLSLRWRPNLKALG